MQTNLQRPQKLFVLPIQYEIPAFQRRYVWRQEEQWEPLWADVVELAQSILEDGDAKPHFLGAVVLQQLTVPTGSIERRIVVDGQQRLTTLQLLIDAIQEVLEDQQFRGPAKRLLALVENSDEFRDDNPDHAFKVWPTSVDRVPFRHTMSNNLSDDDFSTSRVVQAHDFFKGQTEHWLDQFSTDDGDREEAASALEKAVRMHLEIVVIDLGDSDDPHIIFETMNARGTPLLQSDMIKNKILHDAKIDLGFSDTKRSSKEIQLWPFSEDIWWASEVGRGLQRRPRIDVFVNHWLTLRNLSETRQYDEFSVFDKYCSSKVASGDDIEAIARDIATIGDIYKNVEEFRRDDIRVFVERRNLMNIGATSPLLLWLLSSSVPQSVLSTCLKALESFLVRRVICGYGARSYSDLFVSLIARLSEASAQDADKILVSYLGEQTSRAGIWPRDHEVLERFINAPLYQWLTRGRLAMVLTGIEKELRTALTETQDVPGNLHIEHIMPQAWYGNWPLERGDLDEASATEHRNLMVHTMGNLTLVNARLNSTLSNAPWSRKRDTLNDHSILLLNRILVKEGPQVWDEEAIVNRAKWLHEYFIEIWPYAMQFNIE